MVKICVLCGTEIEGHGNNPAPLNQGHGRCCDGCNTDLVIPMRIYGSRFDVQLMQTQQLEVLWTDMMRKRRKAQSKTKYVPGMSLEDVLELQRRIEENNYSPQNWRYIRNGGIEDEEG